MTGHKNMQEPYMSTVGLIMAPVSCPLSGERVFPDVMKFRGFRWGDYPGLPREP